MHWLSVLLLGMMLTLCILGVISYMVKKITSVLKSMKQKKEVENMPTAGEISTRDRIEIHSDRDGSYAIYNKEISTLDHVYNVINAIAEDNNGERPNVIYIKEDSFCSIMASEEYAVISRYHTGSMRRERRIYFEGCKVESERDMPPERRPLTSFAQVMDRYNSSSLDLLQQELRRRSYFVDRFSSIDDDIWSGRRVQPTFGSPAARYVREMQQQAESSAAWTVDNLCEHFGVKEKKSLRDLYDIKTIKRGKHGQNM